MSINITVEGGSSKRLLTAGKYCPEDIVVTAAGGAPEDLNAVLTEQEQLIATLQETLRGKTAGEGGGDESFRLLMEEGILRNDDMTDMVDNICRNWYYLKEIDLPNVKRAAGYICYSCTNLESVNLPNCETLGAYAFYNCTKLQTLDFPKLTSVPGNVFRQCIDVTYVSLPLCTSLGTNALQKVALVEKMDFPVLGTISATAFDQCSALVAVILRKSSVCTLTNKSAFNSTPIAAGTGYIYVPKSLQTEYQSASNWSVYESQIRAIEDYPEICGEV